MEGTFWQRVSTPILFGATINQISNPKEFFGTYIGKSKLESLVKSVRSAFGRMDMDYNDIYLHVTKPEKVLLLERKRFEGPEVEAMAAYTSLELSGIPSLIVEGIAVAPEMQGKGVFKEMTEFASNKEPVICLRTQNPRMYRALEKYCSVVYPGDRKAPGAIKEIRQELAKHLGCQITEEGIVRGYFGGLFYGEEPTHITKSSFFKEQLGMDLDKGDALLVIGIK